MAEMTADEQLLLELVNIDLNGDRKVDVQIELSGLHDLTVDDFIL